MTTRHAELLNDVALGLWNLGEKLGFVVLTCGWAKQIDPNPPTDETTYYTTLFPRAKTGKPNNDGVVRVCIQYDQVAFVVVYGCGKNKTFAPSQLGIK